MSLRLTSKHVWEDVEKNSFAVLGMVTANDEARTVGIVYVVHDHKLYIGAEPTAWSSFHTGIVTGMICHMKQME